MCQEKKGALCYRELLKSAKGVGPGNPRPPCLLLEKAQYSIAYNSVENAGRVKIQQYSLPGGLCLQISSRLFLSRGGGLQGSSRLPSDFITLGKSHVNFLSLTFLSHVNKST